MYFFKNGLHLLLGTCINQKAHIHKLNTIKHHSTFKNKGILIVKPKLLQKYILRGKTLIHKKKYKK